MNAHRERQPITDGILVLPPLAGCLLAATPYQVQALLSGPDPPLRSILRPDATRLIRLDDVLRLARAQRPRAEVTRR